MRKFRRIKGSVASYPQRATEGSAGYDIRSYEQVTIRPMECVYINTGLKVYMEKDEVLLVAPRSSLFKKYHCIVPNSLGVIDSDFVNNLDNEGHFVVPLYNLSTTESVTIPFGERIAQGIFTKYLTVDDDSPVFKERTGGFGSTDKQ